MSRFVKLNPTKPFTIQEGERLGRIIINGRCIERSIETFKNTNRDDDNRFLRKFQKRLLERSMEWMKNKMIK